MDSAILGLSLYPVDNAIGFPNDYSLDSYLSSLVIYLACKCFARETHVETQKEGRKWGKSKERGGGGGGKRRDSTIHFLTSGARK